MLSKVHVPGWRFSVIAGCFVAPEAWHVVQQVIEELANPELLGHRHGQRSVYKRGCVGPLCRKAMRDYGREYQRKRFRAKTTRPNYLQRFDELLDALNEGYSRALEQDKQAELQKVGT